MIWLPWRKKKKLGKGVEVLMNALAEKETQIKNLKERLKFMQIELEKYKMKERAEKWNL